MSETLTCADCAFINEMQPCEACPNYRYIFKGSSNE